jgi:ribosomal protein S18 acetylase RimI-like enzyme
LTGAILHSARIEQLSTGDEGRLRSIRLRALSDTPDAFGTTFDEASARPCEDWQRQLDELVTFVAADGECDLGIARGARHDNWNDTAYLLSMWVAPEVRRRGIAAALVDSVIDWATANGFSRLLLDVAEGNLAAIALYTKKGFVANGTLGTLPPPRQHIRELQFEMQL